MREERNTWSRAKLGIGLEVLAVASAIGVAVVLTRDNRATAANVTSVWLAVVASAVPVIFSVMRVGKPLGVDMFMSLLILSAIGGNYAIGGIALAIPTFFLVMGGAVHHTAALDRQRPRRIVRRAMLVLGALLFLGGLVSVGAGIYLAPVGLLLLLASGISKFVDRDDGAPRAV